MSSERDETRPQVRRSNSTSGTRRQALYKLGLCVLLLLFPLAGCLSPTLPLPPPSRPSLSALDGSGNVTVTGHVRSRATAYVRNTRTDQIVGEVTDDSGFYELTIGAEVGDVLDVWQQYNTEESDSISVIVSEEGTDNGDIPPPGGMGGAAPE